MEKVEKKALNSFLATYAVKQTYCKAKILKINGIFKNYPYNHFYSFLGMIWVLLRDSPAVYALRERSGASVNQIQKKYLQTLVLLKVLAPSKVLSLLLTLTLPNRGLDV